MNSYQLRPFCFILLGFAAEFLGYRWVIAVGVLGAKCQVTLLFSVVVMVKHAGTLAPCLKLTNWLNTNVGREFTRVILIWGTGVGWMAGAQATYGVATAAESV